MFTNKDVAEYYDTTQTHYQKWWNLGKSFSLHYGIWDERVKSFSESLVNTNRVMMELSEISETDRILDARCGVMSCGLAKVFARPLTKEHLSENVIES